MKRNMLVFGFRAALFGVCTFAVQGASADGQRVKTVALMTYDERRVMVAEMQRVLDVAMTEKQFYPDESLPLVVKVGLDESGNVITVDFDERFAERAYDVQTADMSDFVFGRLWPFMEKIDGTTGVRFLYGGRDPEYWPENRRPESLHEESRRHRRSAVDTPFVVVSPGHGVYYNGKFKDWRAQRETWNGVLEDDITPALASNLEAALMRDGVRVDNLRREGQPLKHEASQQPWWRLAARYQLAQRIPELTSIWNSAPEKPVPFDGQEERNQDIRSRPLYANHVKAQALIHVHTNGEVPEATGFRTYIVDRPEDQALASRILCSAKELIGTNERFASFTVAPAPHVKPSQAENNLAAMPSVIVEVGFHTNPADAELLKDQSFRSLAMRGVAKGYRLYRNKLPCQQFAVGRIQDTAGRVGVDVRIPLAVKGNPAFPVTVRSKDVSCTGRGCHDKDKMLFAKKDLDAFKVQFLCKREDVARSPISVAVTARDADGVKAVPTTFKVACKAG